MNTGKRLHEVDLKPADWCIVVPHGKVNYTEIEFTDHWDQTQADNLHLWGWMKVAFWFWSG
jgi:hypothetical protein